MLKKKIQPYRLKDRKKYRRRNACVHSDSQARRLHPRIAGVSPACGCTQPLMSEV
ncbi:MAG: hypothetical protein LBP59_04345 [Planctomycetaceae bacterium]|nr:hypothetical protein [Planctomycetaceae bacterium]